MKQFAIAMLAFALSAPVFAHTADKGIVVDGSYGMTRFDQSDSSVSVSTNEVWKLGAGYMWQPTLDYAQGVMVNYNRYHSLRFKEVGGDDSISVNGNAYDLVYAGEFQLSRHVAFIFDGGYSLLELKAEKGQGTDYSNGITGSAGLAYMIGSGGETMVYVEAQGARYFDFGDVGGETAAIMAGNIGIRHRF